VCVRANKVSESGRWRRSASGPGLRVRNQPTKHWRALRLNPEAAVEWRQIIAEVPSDKPPD
jgi:hypothetical protein